MRAKVVSRLNYTTLLPLTIVVGKSVACDLSSPRRLSNVTCQNTHAMPCNSCHGLLAWLSLDPVLHALTYTFLHTPQPPCTRPFYLCTLIQSLQQTTSRAIGTSTNWSRQAALLQRRRLVSLFVMDSLLLRCSIALSARTPWPCPVLEKLDPVIKAPALVRLKEVSCTSCFIGEMEL